MTRCTIAKTFAFAAVAMLAVSAAPAAKAQDKGCTNSSLTGTFAFNGFGFIVSPAMAAGPFADVNTLTFDGNGGVTAASGSVSQNGNIAPITEKGTYKVNPDCTGTYTVLISPLGFTAHYYFVMDNTESELQIVCTDAGVAFAGVARLQFPLGDWRH